MLWIKEVELVDSVDDLKSLCSVKGLQMPNFEVLDAKIASALNRIIRNTQFKRKVRLEEQKAQTEDRFLRGRQIAYVIYEYFRVTGANDSVENYADLFTIVLENDDIQEFDSKWEGILLSMTKILSNDILEGLYKLRKRESEELKTVLERNAVVKNQGTKQRGQRTLGDCWQWKTNGQCSKGDNCSFRHDINKRAKLTQPNPSPSSSTRQNERNASRTRSPRGKSPSGRMSRWPCKDYLKGTCTNSFCEKWHPPECLFYKIKSVVGLVKSARMRIARLKNCLAKSFKKNGDKSAVAMLKNTRQLGCVFPGYGAAKVFIDFTEELRHTETDPMCKIHESRCTSR